MKWIPIKDQLPPPGIAVLAVARWEHCGKPNHRVIRAEWSDGRSLLASYECYDEGLVYDEENDCFYVSEGWYESNFYEETHWSVEGSVTHWQPLPEAPEMDDE